MKNKFFIGLVILLLLVITGCGSSKEKVVEPTKNDSFKDMVGEYKIDSLKYDKKTYKRDDLEKSGRDAKLKVNDDKTMVLSYKGKDHKFTYNSKYVISKSKDNKKKNKYTFKDDALTIDIKGMGKMIFKKVNK